MHLQHVAVGLPGARLDLVVRQPGLLHVVAEALAAAARVAQVALGDPGLSPLPGPVGLRRVAKVPADRWRPFRSRYIAV